MNLKMIGTIFIVLLILVILCNIWFYFVDGMIEKVKRLFFKSEKTENWHTLEELDEKNSKNKI